LTPTLPLGRGFSTTRGAPTSTSPGRRGAVSFNCGKLCARARCRTVSRPADGVCASYARRKRKRVPPRVARTWAACEETGRKVDRSPGATVIVFRRADRRYHHRPWSRLCRSRRPRVDTAFTLCSASRTWLDQSAGPRGDLEFLTWRAALGQCSAPFVRADEPRAPQKRNANQRHRLVAAGVTTAVGSNSPLPSAADTRARDRSAPSSQTGPTCPSAPSSPSSSLGRDVPSRFPPAACNDEPVALSSRSSPPRGAARAPSPGSAASPSGSSVFGPPKRGRTRPPRASNGPAAAQASEHP